MNHVYPVDDLREHVLKGVACWCRPELDEEYEVVIHNSMDRREEYEEGREMS